VIPVIKKLAAKNQNSLSIDTMKPAVARAALAPGRASSTTSRPIASDDAMWKIVAEFRAGYICMHAQGSPQTMQKNPAYRNVVREVGDFFHERLEKLNACGVSSTRWCSIRHRFWQDAGA
jgi:dihydropteroate synthase